MTSFVYILECSDGSYYVGSARGETAEPRIHAHNSGHYGGYTASRRPVEVKFIEHFERVTDAIAAERKIKGWSRAKKEALIGGDFDKLKSLSSRKKSSENQDDE